MISNNLSSGASSNVSNLKLLNSAILGFGNIYNPINAQISYTALQSTYVHGQSAINAVDIALAANTNAKNTRSKSFGSLSKLMTRIGNAFKSIITDESARTQIRSMILLIQKGRVNPKKTKPAVNAITEDPAPAQGSISHKSGYEKQLDNFSKLIQFLASFPTYKPNEADLSVAGLTAWYNELALNCQAVIDTQTNLDKSRRDRENVIYQPVTGLVQLGNDSKSYIKSVFGAGSLEYRQISKIKFTSSTS